ncbi:hypothetical protein D9M69_697990 [compost metagenome]
MPSGRRAHRNMPPLGALNFTSRPAISRCSAAIIASRWRLYSARMVGTWRSRKPSFITAETMRCVKIGVCRSTACLACSSLGKMAFGATRKPRRRPGASTLENEPR